MELPSGALADIVGRKKSVIVGWIITIVSHVGMGLSITPFAYIFMSLVGGFGGAFISGADVALVYDSLKEAGREREFAKVQGKGMLLGRVAIIIASFTGGFMFNIHPALPYVAMGVMELLGMGCYVLMYEPYIDTIKFTFKGYVTQLKQGVAEAFKNVHVKYLTVFYALVGGITLSSLFFFNYSYAMELGLGAVGQSVLFGVTGAIKAIAVFGLSKYLHKINKKWIFLSFAILIVVIYTPAIFATRNLALIIIGVSEFIASSRFAVLDQYVNDEFESKVRATALSFLNMLVSFVYMVLLFAGGYMADRYSTSALYTAIGIASLVTVVPITLLLIRTKSVKALS